MNAQAGSGRSLSLYLMVVSRLCNRSWDVDESWDELFEIQVVTLYQMTAEGLTHTAHHSILRIHAPGAHTAPYNVHLDFAHGPERARRSARPHVANGRMLWVILFIGL